MSSTLPRSRSLSSGGVTCISSPSLALLNKDKTRPKSLCESSWGRIVPLSEHNGALLRQKFPSQANNLSTTVPCSLVTKKLGARHTPTRNSLRHSRMVVRKKSVSYPVRRWSVASSTTSLGIGRVGCLVITTQTVLGVLLGALAGWCLMWAPRSIPFREVPHYAALPIFISGVLGVLLLTCCSERRRKSSATALKGFILIFSCIAIVACLCVCIFTALHLVYLAPMKCRENRDFVRYDLTTPKNIAEDIRFSLPYFDHKNTTANHDRHLEPENLLQIDIDSNNRSVMGSNRRESTDENAQERRKFESQGQKESMQGYKNPGTHFDEELDEEGGEGSGMDSPNDENSSQKEGRIFNSEIDVFADQRAIHMEIIYCVCESTEAHWKRTLRYPDLRCAEVNRVLPVLSIATCIITAGGAILSGVVLYLLWTSKESFYDPIRPSEIRPVVYSSSNLKRNNSVQSKINGIPYWNGNVVQNNMNGHSMHIV